MVRPPQRVANGTIAAIAFRARALNSCGRAQDARRLLSESFALHPKEADLFIAFGDIAFMHKHYELAADYNVPGANVFAGVRFQL